MFSMTIRFPEKEIFVFEGFFFFFFCVNPSLAPNVLLYYQLSPKHLYFPKFTLDDVTPRFIL
jgi:hypothetical protein